MNIFVLILSTNWRDVVASVLGRYLFIKLPEKANLIYSALAFFLLTFVLISEGIDFRHK